MLTGRPLCALRWVQVEDLLRFGFSPLAADPLITRHACTTLQRLGTNFKAG